MASVCDSGVCNLLSSYFHPEERGTIKRFDAGLCRRRVFQCNKCLDRYNISVGARNFAGGGGCCCVHTRPVVCVQMCGVDKFDQNMSYYTEARRSPRWNFAVFERMLQTWEACAYLLHKQGGGVRMPNGSGGFVTKVLTHKQFKEQLIRELLGLDGQSSKQKASQANARASQHAWTDGSIGRKRQRRKRAERTRRSFAACGARSRVHGARTVAERSSTSQTARYHK